MNILLDKNIPRYLKRVLKDYSVATVQELGLSGTKNGALLSLIEERFDVFIAADKNLKYQQNLEGRNVAILELYSNRLPAIKRVEPAILDALNTIQPGSYVEVNDEG